MGRVRTWWKGSVQVRVTGNHPERFLSLLHHKGIHIWKLEPAEQGYRFLIERAGVRELDAIRRKTGSHLQIEAKHGFPAWLFRYRRRKFFIIGCILAGGMVYVCSLFVWDIEVEGTYFYTDEQIAARIEEEYIPLGKRRSQVDCDWLEEQLRQDFPELSWVSCELTGTRLQVKIKETLEGTEMVTEDTKPQDVLAAKDGTIVEMITRSGTPVAQVGQSIAKGDILISGVVYIYDDYDEVLETDYVAADGDVVAETVYTYEDSFAMQYYEKQYTQKTQRSLTLEILNWVPELHLPWKAFANYDVVEETHQLRLGNTYILPISITTSERREYTPVLVTYTEEEAKKRAEVRLENYLSSLSEKEVEIMENNVTIEIKEGVCHVSGTLVVWERIGYGRPLTIPAEPETESGQEDES